MLWEVTATLARVSIMSGYSDNFPVVVGSIVFTYSVKTQLAARPACAIL